MADEIHLQQLRHGARAWGRWRKKNPEIVPDLSRAELLLANLKLADLSGANLEGANLSGANLKGADLSGANLSRAVLREVSLREANLSGTMLSGAYLRRADMAEAYLNNADLSWADLSQAGLNGAFLMGANLKGANLNQCSLIETNLSGANLSSAKIYGVAAWQLDLTGTNQTGLVITRPEEPLITVDNFKIGQFIQLVLQNRDVREVITGINTKIGLIIGRFSSPEQMATIDRLREELHQYDYLPVLADLENCDPSLYLETVLTLAGLAHFVIAEVSDSLTARIEVSQIAQNVCVPVIPICQAGQVEPIPFFSPTGSWLLPLLTYSQPEDLFSKLAEKLFFASELILKEKERRLKIV